MENGKGKIAAKSSRASTIRCAFGAARARFGQDSFAIFAGLAKIDVDCMDIVAFILQPAEDH